MPVSPEFLKKILPMLAQQAKVDPGLTGAVINKQQQGVALPAPAPAVIPTISLQPPQSANTQMGMGATLPPLGGAPLPQFGAPTGAAAPRLPQDDFWQRQLQEYYGR